jgi:hypothetical protein
MRALFLCCFALSAGQAEPNTELPKAVSVDPLLVRPGTVVTISGVRLGQDRVKEVLISSNGFDQKVKVLEQSEKALKVRIPPFVQAGQFQLIFSMGGEPPVYAEQDQTLRVTLEELPAAAPSAPALPPAKGAGKRKRQTSSQ